MASGRSFQLLGNTYVAWAKSAGGAGRLDKAEAAYRVALPIFRKLADQDVLVGPDMEAGCGSSIRRWQKYTGCNIGIA